MGSGRRHVVARQRRRREVAPPPGPWRLTGDHSSPVLDQEGSTTQDDLGAGFEPPRLADGEPPAPPPA
jgi:hypothetical protein